MFSTTMSFAYFIVPSTFYFICARQKMLRKSGKKWKKTLHYYLKGFLHLGFERRLDFGMFYHSYFE
jgi:hypothetical protein